MASLFIYTMGTSPVFIGDFYTYARPERALRVERPLTLFPHLRALRQAVLSESVAVGVCLTEDEKQHFFDDNDPFVEV